jgi:hypothetical protein
MSEVRVTYTTTGNKSKKQYHLTFYYKEQFVVWIKFANGINYPLAVERGKLTGFICHATLRKGDIVYLTASMRGAEIQWKEDKLSNSVIWLDMRREGEEQVKEQFTISSNEELERLKQVILWFPFAGYLRGNVFTSRLEPAKILKIKDYIETREENI